MSTDTTTAPPSVTLRRLDVYEIARGTERLELRETGSLGPIKRFACERGEVFLWSERAGFAGVFADAFGAGDATFRIIGGTPDVIETMRRLCAGSEA